MNTIKLLFERVLHIIRNEGWAAFIRAMFLYLRYHLFFCRKYYLIEIRLTGTAHDELLPLINDYSLIIITHNNQVEALTKDGYQLCPWYPVYRESLNRGAVAFCVFIKKELGHISWGAFNKEALKSLGEPPIKADFANNESVSAAHWTNPKYRGKRLSPYATRKRYQYLREIGKVVDRGAMAIDNVAVQRASSRGNHRVYAIGRRLRILWWQSWKEMPLDPSVDPSKESIKQP